MRRRSWCTGLAAGLSLLLSLASPTAQAEPPTDDLGRVGTTKDCQGNCRTFLVNFVILSPVDIPDVEAAMQAEIDILNAHFRTEKGYQLFEFVKKRVTPYSEVKRIKTCSELKALGRLRHELDSGRHKGERREAIQACFTSSQGGARTLFDHEAINFYVFDNYETRGSSGGAKLSPNKRWPFLFVDHERLGHVHAVEEHEMGHAFAKLEHVCRVGIEPMGPTPIMATSHHWPGASNNCRAHGGRMGNRTIGFSNATESHQESLPRREIDQIRAEADNVQRALGPKGSPPPASPAQW